MSAVRAGLEPTDKRSVALAGLALGFAALQAIPLRHEHAEERLGRRWLFSAAIYVTLWIFELVAFFCAFLNAALHTLTTTLDNTQNWQRVQWFGWASSVLLLLAWMSEFLSMTVKTRSNELAFEGRRARAYVRPRIPLDRPEDEPQAGPLLLAATTSAAFALALSISAVVLAAIRDEDLKICRQQTVSSGVLAVWVLLSFLCYATIVSMQMFLWDICLGWNFVAMIARLPGLYAVELAIATVEAVPCVLISALAVATLAPRAYTGCETIGRRLAVISLLMCIGPVAKVVRQCGRRMYVPRGRNGGPVDEVIPRARRRTSQPLTTPPGTSDGAVAGRTPAQMESEVSGSDGDHSVSIISSDDNSGGSPEHSSDITASTSSGVDTS